MRHVSHVIDVIVYPCSDTIVRYFRTIALDKLLANGAWQNADRSVMFFADNHRPMTYGYVFSSQRVADCDHV